jgi:hypothetical protein
VRVRLLTVPFALAIVVACIGSDHFSGPGTGVGIGGGVTDASVPDSGNPDGGFPDAGSPDGGGCLLPPGPVAVPVETCGVGGTGQTANFIAASCQDVTISVVPDGEACHGTLGGPTNRFTGTCTNTVGTCTSNNTPGIIHCTLAGSTAPCAIQICADADGGFCPP